MQFKNKKAYRKHVRIMLGHGIGVGRGRKDLSRGGRRSLKYDNIDFLLIPNKFREIATKNVQQFLQLFHESCAK